MFVVSGHLYRPLPLSQPCGLKVKIKDRFGTRPLTFLGAGLSILVFFWHPSPVGSTIRCGLKNRSDIYSFALWAPYTPFAYMPTLIYFGVGVERGNHGLSGHTFSSKALTDGGGLQVPHLVLKIHPC